MASGAAAPRGRSRRQGGPPGKAEAGHEARAAGLLALPAAAPPMPATASEHRPASATYTTITRGCLITAPSSRPATRGLNRLNRNKPRAVLELARLASNKRTGIERPLLVFGYRTDDPVKCAFALRLDRTPHVRSFVKKGDIDRVHGPIRPFRWPFRQTPPNTTNGRSRRAFRSAMLLGTSTWQLPPCGADRQGLRAALAANPG
jgi:hypothetical protein